MYIFFFNLCVLIIFLPFSSQDPPTLNVPTRSPYWGTMRVRFAFNKDTTNSFLKFPTTVWDAQRVGFVPLGTSGCATPACYVGCRYIRNNDNGILLIFDTNGFIAGVQSRIPVDPTKNYPPQFLISHPFVKEDNFWVTSVYFIEPSRICTGRTSQQFTQEGLGDAFYFQNGSNPYRDIIYIPKFQKEFQNKNFNKIGCLEGMGTHYAGYELKIDLDCDKLFPLLPIYDHGILISFDWLYLPTYNNPIFEHLIPYKAYAELIGPKPTCLYNMEGNVTSLHVYMINDPQEVVCTPDSTKF